MEIMLLSLQRAAICFPSGLKIAFEHCLSGKDSRVIYFSLSRFQSLTVPSMLLDTAYFPMGSVWKEVMNPRCPVRILFGLLEGFFSGGYFQR